MIYGSLLDSSTFDSSSSLESAARSSKFFANEALTLYLRGSIVAKADYVVTILFLTDIALYILAQLKILIIMIITLKY